MDNNLCMVCSSILDQFQAAVQTNRSPNNKYFHSAFDHHQNLQSFEDALALGCQLCHLLLNCCTINLTGLSGLVATEPHSIFHLSFMKIGKPNDAWVLHWGFCEKGAQFGGPPPPPPPSGAPATKKKTITRLGSLFMPAGKTLDIRELEGSPDQKLEPNGFHPVAMENSTDSDTTWSTMQDWYQDCLLNHPKCSISEKYRLPTRLIEIDGHKLKLCYSSQIPQHSKYSTLSHCWGGMLFTRLLKDNVKEFLTKIPASELSKTFQNAIKITKNLGLKYLWIDSICIIQDDKEDWRREAATMADIYSYSSINIAAADAENGTVGCFFNRELDGFAVLSTKLNLEVAGKNYVILNGKQLDRVEFSELVKRGWCFQERFLPPRTLQFTRSQVYWECATQDNASERFPAGCPDYMSEVRRSGLVRKERLNVVWERAVEAYSQGKLTYGTDKLIALSGIAKWYQRKTGDSYLAGIWAASLAQHLAWQTLSQEGVDGKHVQKPSTYQAPSWSWASQNRPVVYAFSPWPLSARSKNYVTLVDAQIQTIPPDSLGQVTSGTLRLNIPCIWQSAWYRHADGTYYIDSPWKGDGDPIFKGYFDHDPELKELMLYYLPLVNHWEGHYHHIEGMMLEGTGERGRFKRSGYWQLVDDANRGSKKDLAWCDRAFENYCDGIVSAGYERFHVCKEDELYESVAGVDHDGEKRYVISLV